MVTAATLRKLALALPDAVEVPHMDRAAFRTPRRIFVTLAPDAQTANLMFGAEEQELFCRALPSAFAPVEGGWGKMGATTVVLAAVTESQLRDALQAAHARAVAPAKRKRR